MMDRTGYEMAALFFPTECRDEVATADLGAREEEGRIGKKRAKGRKEDDKISRARRTWFLDDSYHESKEKMQEDRQGR